MNKVTIGEYTYYDIETFMKMNNINVRKTVYNWIESGKAIKKKIGSNAFFKKA